MSQKTGEGVEIWRGGVTPWQCDEMGHMNVQFYVAIATEALAGLAAALGMPRAFSPGATSTLLVREHHMRFLREARAGAGLMMTGGVLSIGETEAVLLQLLHHTSGEPAAALTTRVSHVTPQTMKPFPWSKATRRLADSLMMQAPDNALPRSISAEPVTTMASTAAADALGLPIVATGAIRVADCDAFGHMLPERMLARIYASVSHIFRRSQDAAIAASPDLRDRLGSAMVEYRALYHAWPGIGDRVQMRAGYRALTPKSRSLVYWLLDPGSGRPWVSAEAVSLFLDLKARRALLMPEEVVAAMAVNRIDGLEL